MEYRFYLLDRTGYYCAAETFRALTDQVAMEIAGSVYNAAADAFYGYELWCGFHCVAKLQAPMLRVGKGDVLAGIVLARQENILDLEDRLQQTFECLKKSKRLLRASAKLRQPSDWLPRSIFRARANRNRFYWD